MTSEGRSPSPERVIHDALYSPDCDCDDPEQEGRKVLAALNAAGYAVLSFADIYAAPARKDQADV